MQNKTKCIIGGGSSFIDTLDLSLLDNNNSVCVIGCNYWGLNFKCDIGIMQDAWLCPTIAIQLREKVNVLALKDYELNTEVRNKADYLYSGSSRLLTPQYNGSLYCGRTVALGALQLALQLGYTDILCVGFDCTSLYSEKWNNKTVNEFKELEINMIKERIQELEQFFKVKVHNANFSNMLEMPYKSFYEFISND